jgi:hypothetical protein
MRGVVEYNPGDRARPPRLVRESSHTPVFEEAEIVAFLDSIRPDSLKDVRDSDPVFCSIPGVGCLLWSTDRPDGPPVTANVAARAGYGSEKNE